MIASIFALCLLALARPVEPQESALTADGTRVLLDQGHAFLELSSPQAEYVVGQPFWIVLHIGIEREFAESNLIQMFRTPLELPVQLQADWLGAHGKLEALGDAPQPSGAALRFALLGNQAAAEPLENRELGGAVYRVYEYKQRFKVSEAQTLKLSAAELRYAFATEFEENFLSGRIPSNRIDAMVRSAPLQLKIQALPLDQPPIDFSGAVGVFEVSARLGKPEAAAAGKIQWILRIQGQGNLSDLAPPSLVQLRDFSVQGTLASEVEATDGESAREFRYDLVPKGERPVAIPAYRFTYFDVKAYSFETLSTEPLVLAPLESNPRGLSAAPQAAATSSRAPGSESGFAALPWLLYLGIPAGCLLGVFLLRRRSLRGARKALPAGALAKPQSSQRASALRDFEAALVSQEQELLVLYADYLGACLGGPGEELQAKGLGPRLEREGIPSALAARAEAALASLLGARYGRGECDQQGQAAAAVVRELAQHWPR